MSISKHIIEHEILGVEDTTTLDSRYVNITGDSMTGDLVISSTNAGGENTTDSTNRLILNSHQRAEHNNNFGEVIRMYADHEQAKQMLAWYKRFNTGTVTFTDAGELWTAVAHRFQNGDRVVLSTTGALPTGFSAGTTTGEGITTGTVYFVISATDDTFQLSTTVGGAAVSGTGTGTGTHTVTIVPKLKAWIGWHYRPNDDIDTLDPHDHISIETPDAEGTLLTRLEVVATDADTTQINTFNSNFTVIQGVSGVSGVSGAAKSFSIYDAGNDRDKTLRWSLQGNSTAESGSDVGSDFQISSFDDAGAFTRTPFFIKRSTGRVGIGTTDPAAKLHLEHTANENIFYLKSTHAGASTAANALIEGDNVADRMIQARVTGDTVARLSVEASGKMEWGAGGGTARDTNLYRNAADVLKTDDALVVGGAITVTSGSITGITDLAVADGGTGASSAATAIANLGGLPIAGGTMSGNITLGENTSIALDPAGSADGKYTGITVAGTAGATLAFGDLVYLAAVDSRWELADADAASTSGDVMLGMCVLAAASDGSATTILLNGIIRADAAFPALTISAQVYVSTTAGDIQVAQPSGVDDVIRVVGRALTVDEIYFNPSEDYVTHI